MDSDQTQFDLSFLTDPQSEAQPLKVHCPHCLKSFKVNQVSLKSKRPQFNCPDCKKGFWFHNAGLAGQGSIMAFPLEWLQTSENQPQRQTETVPTSNYRLYSPPTPTAEKTKSCPSCGNKTPARIDECTSCGLLFKRYKILREANDDFKVSAKVRRYWESVIQNYFVEPKHYEFIKSCMEDGSLDYAAYRYKCLADALPDDTLAGRMLLYVEHLVSAKADSMPRRSGSREFSFGESWLGLTVLLSAMVIVMGVIFPGQKNLVGLGSLALFIALTLKIIRR